MNTIANPYKKLLEDKKVKNDFNTFDETFRVKLFYEKYRNVAQLCSGASWLFNALSVGSGVLGLASLLASFVYDNLWLMAIPSLVVLVLSELFKRFLLRNLIIEKYRDEHVNKGLLIANIALIAISSIATIYGGFEAVQLARGKAKPTLVNLAQLEAKYDQKIKLVRADKQALIDNNSYDGKAYLSKADKALKVQYVAKIDRLELEQKQALAKAEKSNKQKLTVYHAGTQDYVLVFVVLSLVIESLCIVTLIFPIYYQHKSKQEKAIIMASLQPANLNPDYLLALLQRAGVSTVELLQQAPQAPLMPVANEPTASKPPKEEPGSNEPKPDAPNPTPNEPTASEPTPKQPVSNEPKPDAPTPQKAPVHRPRGKVVNYERVYELIDQGGLTSAEIATLCKCSESTVRTAKRKRKQAKN